MGPKIQVLLEKAVEVHIVHPHWRAGTKIDGAEYVFLGGKDKGMGGIGEGTGGKCGCLESWLFVCKGEEHSPVKRSIRKDIVGSSSHTFTNSITGHSLSPSSSQVVNTT